MVFKYLDIPHGSCILYVQNKSYGLIVDKIRLNHTKEKYFMRKALSNSHKLSILIV